MAKSKKGSSALKKITTAAKAYRKKHPGASWKSAVKKAGTAYRTGKLKPKRKPAKKAAKKRVVRKRVVRKKTIARKKYSPRKVAKRKSVKRSKSRKRVGAVSSVTGTKKRRTYKKRRKVAKVSGVRRRVSGGGKNKLLTILAIAGVGIGAYMLLKGNQPRPVYYQTGNYARDMQAQQILSWVTAAGATASQLAALINSLNNKTDAQIQQDYYNIQSGGNIAYA